MMRNANRRADRARAGRGGTGPASRRGWRALPECQGNVLFIGAERPEEFREALRLRCQGHNVLVVNPKDTDAARSFEAAGGSFVRMRVEDLPSPCAQFFLIRENYPYPSGRHYVPPGPFAVARLGRLARGGVWVLHTEAVRYASLLKGFVDHDPRVARHFEARLTRVPINAAPRSDYPPTDVRYRLMVRRRA